MSDIEDLRQENEILKKRLKLLGKPISEIISPRLRPLRKQKRLSQEELGKMIGVTKGTISTYESGDREPPLKTLIKIADALDVSLDWLCGRTD